MIHPEDTYTFKWTREKTFTLRLIFCIEAVDLPPLWFSYFLYRPTVLPWTRMRSECVWIALLRMFTQTKLLWKTQLVFTFTFNYLTVDLNAYKRWLKISTKCQIQYEKQISIYLFSQKKHNNVTSTMVVNYCLEGGGQL